MIPRLETPIWSVKLNISFAEAALVAIAFPALHTSTVHLISSYTRVIFSRRSNVIEFYSVYAYVVSVYERFRRNLINMRKHCITKALVI